MWEFKHYDETKTGRCISHPFELRLVQKKAVDEILEHKHGIIALATGVGKTVVGWELMNQLDCPRTLMLVPLLSLIDQFKAKLEERVRPRFLPIGSFSSRLKDVQHITISTYQSAVLNPYIFDDFDLIILDEAHHLLGEKRLDVLLPLIKQKPYAVGQTATPPLRGEIPEADAVLDALPVLIHMDMQEAQEWGYLAPTELSTVDVDFTIGEKMMYNEVSDKIRKATMYLGTSHPRKVGRLLKTGTDTQKIYAKMYFKGVSDRAMILSDVDAKPDEVLNICRTHEKAKILLFTSRVYALKKIVAYLNEHHVPAEYMIAETSRDRRLELLETWGDEFRVLGSVDVIREGMDVPQCSVGIFIAAGYGMREHVQKVGRVLRPGPGKVAHIYAVYVRNTKEEEIVANLKEIVGLPVDELPPEESIWDKWEAIREEYGEEIFEEEPEVVEPPPVIPRPPRIDVEHKYPIGTAVDYFGRSVVVTDFRTSPVGVFVYDLMGREDLLERLEDMEDVEWEDIEKISEMARRTGEEVYERGKIVKYFAHPVRIIRRSIDDKGRVVYDIQGIDDPEYVRTGIPPKYLG